MNRIGLTAFVLSSLAAFTACNTAQGQQKLEPAAFEKELQTSGAQAVLVDVRTPEEFGTGHLQGAQNIDFRAADFEAQINKLDPNKTVFLYCASGGRSEEAAALLTRKGFKSVREMKGGIIAWRNNGLPLANAKPLPRDYTPEQFDEAISGDKLVMVDFYTTWCGPCKMMAPDIERVKQEMSDKVIVMKIDAEAYTDLSSRYRISGYPTVMFFKKGQTLRTLMGRQSYEELAMNVNMFQ